MRVSLHRSIVSFESVSSVFVSMAFRWCGILFSLMRRSKFVDSFKSYKWKRSFCVLLGFHGGGNASIPTLVLARPYGLYTNIKICIHSLCTIPVFATQSGTKTTRATPTHPSTTTMQPHCTLHCVRYPFRTQLLLLPLLRLRALPESHTYLFVS